jgi:glutamate synthase domain-containing protein 3
MRVKKTTKIKKKTTDRDKRSNPPLPPFTKGGREGITDRALTMRGIVRGKRVPSRILEEQIQQAVRDGIRELHIIADGQHGIGGRIWPQEDPVKITIDGPVGQRLGSMGMSGTELIVNGSASDDVGWINCGAKITVLGDVTNGAFNAAAQGVLYVQGSGASR